MKGRQVVLGQLFGAEAAALMVDGQLEDLLVDSSALVPLAPGAICRGIADRPMKGQGGLFLRLPGGASGFLRDRSGIAPGQPVLVQIAGIPESGKAIPVTARLLFRGRAGIVTPDAPGVNVSRRIRDEEARVALTAMGEAALSGCDPRTGMVIRSAAEVADPAEVSDELTQLAQLAAAIADDVDGKEELLLDAPTPWEAAWRDWSEPEDSVLQGETALADSGAEAAIAALLSPEVSLPGGGSAVIEQNRALVAIDVNTGRDSSPAAGLKANIALARDLPRQLRLRGFGGQVVVDFAPIPKRDRGTLEQVLRAAFKGEAAETVLAGWTAMGLFEMSRKRDRVPLARLAAAAGWQL
ncbi:ribonuclease G [Paracoccus suum]|uniref:Ribonuclease G n=1 Tax=Paracoccus suum TaxID=2259340 RepID=A0A344PJ94_9RHOB|nr:ribonuclease E/G [Paracoccus suum]AXC49449.1 ribonuclease G [Paracoccus suum]